MNKSSTPGTIIGYRKNGSPIRLIAGGSDTGQEPLAPVQEPTVPVTGFSQDQLYAAMEKARSEERAKLHTRLESMQSNFSSQEELLKELKAKEDERAAAAAAEAERLAAEQKAAEEEKLSLRQIMDKREQENTAKFLELQHELQRRDAIIQKERERAELDLYRERAVAAAREPRPDQNHFGIADEFIDLVQGSTPEEIDNSVANMVARTRSILEGVQQAQLNAQARMPGVSPNAGNFGPVETAGSTRQYSGEEIAAMDPNSPEFQALRTQYGMGRSTSNRGMFGNSNQGYFG